MCTFANEMTKENKDRLLRLLQQHKEPNAVIVRK